MGWIAIDRAIMENPLWDEKPFAKGQAWIDLLLLANYKDKTILYKGKPVVCKRGDVNLSYTALAERWGWSRQKVSRFIGDMVELSMVTTNVTTHRTVITIENYEKYQSVCTTNVTTKCTTNVTTDGQQLDITKQRNNKTNKQNYSYRDKGDDDFTLDDLRSGTRMRVRDYLHGAGDDEGEK